MEKHRSFSIKPIRCLVFTFTVSFSIVFLVLLSIWVIQTSPPFQQDAHLTKSFTVHSISGSSSNSSQSRVKNSILIGAQFGKDELAARVADVSSFEGIQKMESEIEKLSSYAEKKGEILSGNLNFTSTSPSSNLSVPAAGMHNSSDGNSTFHGSHKSGNLVGTNDSVYSKNTVEGFQELGDVYSNSTSGQQDLLSDNTSFKKTDSSGVKEKKNNEVCDITKGRWVFDGSYSLYTNTTCPFIDEGFNCEANGRLDKDYMKWRWQPQDCDIPRFNATNMLELIRGKRLVFAGDSLNRNQWESMLCLLLGATKDPKKVFETRGRKITKKKGNYSFKFVDYKCTVEYYVTHFLVHESKSRIGKRRTQTLRIDTVDKGSSRWRGADILVFNTAHWWNHHKTKAGINYYQEGDKVHPRLNVSTAFERAIRTWAAWVDKNINPRKTQIFFRSSAPAHFSGGLWNTGGHCREASQPINESSLASYPTRNLIVEERIRQMKTPVTFLNITRLSDYRADGHPSIYGRKSQVTGIEDCSHWCLPGVPDTWNELLYYHLQMKSKTGFVK